MRATPILFLLFTVLLNGCATRGFVRQETGSMEERLAERVSEVEGQIEETQTDVERVEERSERNEQEVAELSQTTREALDRAVAAGKLAEGKFLYETVLTDDQVRFGFDRSELSDEARAALDQFATDVKNKNEDVFIEIQGHTDSIGPDNYNEKLGLERAEAVRGYLSRGQGFALHRMSVISYGESAPIAENDSRENRGKNRRVVLVVLK